MPDRSNYRATLPNGIHLDMVFIEGGSFDMGDRNKHEVEVPSFYLGRYPITNEQFVPFLNEKGNQEEGGRTWMNLEGNYQGVRCGITKSPEGFVCIKGLECHPTIYVSWYGALAYSKWLSVQVGRDFRLPSEAEWEYAARGGRHSLGFRYAGSNKLKEIGWYYLNSHKETKPVGLKLPNELGLYDMSGNVWEWCADHWHENYEGAPTDGSTWVEGGEKAQRVVCGGSWGLNEYDCSVSYRYWYFTDDRLNCIGFRLARY